MFHPGTVAQAHLARVAEDPVLALVVVPPVEANAFRLPPLVVVVFLQGLVAEAAPPSCSSSGRRKSRRWSCKYTSARLLEQTYKTQRTLVVKYTPTHVLLVRVHGLTFSAYKSPASSNTGKLPKQESC